MKKQQLLDLLKTDVVPALGCTEPVCVALCAAYARSVLDGDISHITVTVNTGIYKNGMSAGIPNCSEVGLPYAAAIGASLKNPQRQLELLADVNEIILDKATALVRSGCVQVNLDPEQTSLYVKCFLTASEGSSTCVIRGSHTNMVYLEKTGPF